MPTLPAARTLATAATPNRPERFEALDIALEMIRSLLQPLARLASRDADHANQVHRAASSVSLNLSEGRRRSGKDRAHLCRVAAGSAAEVVASLEIAEAWGHVAADEIEAALALCDRILAICWKLTR
jgi:four helix bundle protein